MNEEESIQAEKSRSAIHTLHGVPYPEWMVVEWDDETQEDCDAFDINQLRVVISLGRRRVVDLERRVAELEQIVAGGFPPYYKQ